MAKFRFYLTDFSLHVTRHAIRGDRWRAWVVLRVLGGLAVMALHFRFNGAIKDQFHGIFIVPGYTLNDHSVAWAAFNEEFVPRFILFPWNLKPTGKTLPGSRRPRHEEGPGYDCYGHWQ